ncbi:MAG: aminotransferase class I/II-fold pyridoxal phosphate-dependent enzyme [Candidatus Sulfobium sp.]
MIKKKLSELAIFGGKPTFDMALHVGRPNIPDRKRLLERINDILDRRWLTNNGPYVREFEKKIAQFTGAKHCICMCNGTVALEIAIRAAGLTGEVIVPSFTFVATAHALQWQEITPVFCDIDPKTHNLNPDCVEKLITPRTTGIIGVHLWGRPCDAEKLEDIARRRRLRLLFDAAHACGCSWQGRMVGNFGNAEVFSFHATKFLNSFEGGAIVTNDDELAGKIRLMKNFGFAGLDNVIYIGTNGKMNEVSAAAGLTALEGIDEVISANRRNYRLYRRELGGLPGFDMVTYNGKEKSNYQYVVSRVDEKAAGISRDSLVKILRAENVLARRYFSPGTHRMEPYRSYFPNSGMLLPETERLAAEIMSLPTGTSVGKEDIGRVCELIKFLTANGDRITRMLERTV